MTQQPFGHEPAAPGPLNEARPGRPDVGPLDERGTPEQPVIQHSGTSLVEPEKTVPDDGGSPYTGDIPISTSDDIGGASGSGSGSGSKVDTAKGEAKQVAGAAVDSGREVAATAKGEAQNVVAETKQQARSLLETVRSEVGEQAGAQQNLVADALHSLSKELGSMASSSQESGPLTDLAHQASRKGGEIAHWLQDREPTDVLEEVRSYARRRPGTFLVLCGLAGVVAGRLTRSAVATRTNLDSKNDTGSEERSTLGTGYTAPQPGGYSTTGLSDPYASAPLTDPVPQTAGGPSTGVYGGTVESTEPAAGTGYVSDPPLPGSGYVGTTDTLDDPNGDPTR